MMTAWIQLAGVFSMLSLLAVGGGSAVLPEMQTLLHQHFNFSQTEFVHAYSVGQLAPGPNMLAVLIMGEMIDGIMGALIVALAFFIPSSILCLYTGRLWQRIGDTPWRRSLQQALEPISIGLMCSGVYTIAKESLVNWQSCAVALVVGVLLLKTKINPVLLILAAAGVGYAGSIL
ncbi:MAG: chromate transporter [Fluviibacter sp.]|jgi:chromate transporter